MVMVVSAARWRRARVEILFLSPGARPGLYIIFQMDWKRYIITLAKILQSSLRPEVYPEMSDSTVSILYLGATTFNMAV